MKSLRHFFHSNAKGLPRNSTDTTTSNSALPKSRKLLSPSDHWTGKQIFTVFVMNGIGSFIISGGINFAVAYGTYGNVNPAKHPVRLWRLPNTLSGDAAVTLFVQTVVTWLITMILANADIRNGVVPPIGFIPEPKNRFMRWYLSLDAEQPIERKSLKQWVLFVLSQIGRALLFCIPLFFLVWPAAVGILTSSTLGSHRGNDYYYARRWTPQVFKLLYGGILGLLQTPPMYMVWLLTIGWRERRAAATLPISQSAGEPRNTTIHNSGQGSGQALQPVNVQPLARSDSGRQNPQGLLAAPLQHEPL